MADSGRPRPASWVTAEDAEPPPERPRLSGRSGRYAVTDRRGDDPGEVPESGRCAAIYRRRFNSVTMQEYPLKQQAVPDPRTQRRAPR